jgi:hypothetical protein
VFNAATVKSIGFQSIGGYSEKLRGFVDHQQGFVFKQNVDLNRTVRGWWGRALLGALSFQHLDEVAVSEVVFGSVNHIAV